MGITDPTAQAAMGLGFGGLEMATEKIGGIGGDLLKPAKTFLGRLVKNTASEAGEEILAGRAQDALTVGAGQFVADPDRPGFTESGYHLPSLNPLNPETLAKMKQEAIGGAAGGLIFSGLQALSPGGNSGKPAGPPAAANPDRKPSEDLPPQRWTPRGQTMADLPPGAELTYDEQERVSGWQTSANAPAAAALRFRKRAGAGSALDTPNQSRVASAFFEAVANDLDGAVQTYIDNFGNVVDTDLARELEPEYAASREGRQEHSRGTSHTANTLAKFVYERLLETARPGEVIFNAGGPGSGKSTTLSDATKARAAIIYDTVMAEKSRAIEQIQQALDAGHHVSINYIHQPLEAAVRNTIDRAARKDNGRIVEAYATARAHKNAQDTIFEVASHFANDPRVRINVVDNTGFANRASSLQELRQSQYHEQLENLVQRAMLEARRHLHERQHQNPADYTAELARRVLRPSGGGNAAGNAGAHGQDKRGLQGREGTSQRAGAPLRAEDGAPVRPLDAQGQSGGPGTAEAQFHTITEAPPVVPIPHVDIPRHPEGMVPALRAWLKGAREGIATRLRRLTGVQNPIDWSKLQSIKQGEDPLHHFQALAALPELYRQSVPVMTNHDTKKQSNTSFVRRYAWALFPDGKRRHVLITGKMHPDYQAQGIYSLEALEVREAALTYMDEHARAAQPSSDQVAQPVKAGGSLGAFLTGIKPEHRPPESAATQGPSGNGGPGASSLNEWGKTTFGQRLKTDERLRASWRQTIGGQYRVESEAEWQQRANDFIEAEGAAGAYALMTDPDSGLSDSDRVAIGLQLILHLDEQIKQTQLAGGDISVLDELLYETAEWIEQKGTKLGQAVRVFGMWTRMSAEGVLRSFERKVNEAREQDAKLKLGDEPQQIADDVNAAAREEREDVAAEALGETTADQLAELQRQVAELRQQLAAATQEASAAQQEATQAPTPADAAQAQQRVQDAQKRRQRPHPSMYKMRPQLSHWVSVSDCLSDWMTPTTTFMWQPPHMAFSIGTTAASPFLVKMRV